MVKKLKVPRQGRIVYEGPSHLPGAIGQEVVVILTFGSGNRKTGNLWTLWIWPKSVLTLNLLPGEGNSLTGHLLSGGDQASCLGCVHSSQGNNTCYVLPLMGKGPTTMIKTLQARFAKGEEVYLSNTDLVALLKQEQPEVRLGGYGDPVALPLWFLHLFTENTDTLGYTHQWARIPAEDRALYAAFLMASVDSPTQALFAQAKGWRTFRVKEKNEPALTSEAMCPASKEYKEKTGKQITCGDCGQCRGQKNKGSKSRVINNHTAWKKKIKQLTVR